MEGGCVHTRVDTTRINFPQRVVENYYTHDLAPGTFL